MGQRDKNLQIYFLVCELNDVHEWKKVISTQRTIKSNNVLLDIMTPHLATVAEDTFVLLLDLSIFSNFVLKFLGH